MRRILVDHARTRRRGKRGGSTIRVALRQAEAAYDPGAPDVLELDRALKELASIDRRKASVVELHFFGGLSVAETAQVMGCSAATVTRDWRLAKAWLYRELAADAG